MWKPRELPDDFKETVGSIFRSMEEPARPGFTDADLSRLYTVIRLTVDFRNFLETVDLTSPNKRDVTFACESISAGIETFMLVNSSYKVLVGSMSSEVKWELSSLSTFKEQFMSMYNEFLSEGTFEYRCRLLLDLFKLQIVFTGMLYD